MSLYELISMVAAIEKRRQAAPGKPRRVTDEELAQADELLRSVTMNDPSVRLLN